MNALKITILFVVLIAGLAAQDAKPKGPIAPENRTTRTKAHGGQLEWKLLGADGTKESVPDLADKPRKIVGSAIVAKFDGTTKIVGQRSLDIKMFRGGGIYSAELPDEIRQKPVFVDFILSGTAGSEPDTGSIINIDGAILGFQLMVFGKDNSRSVAAQVMTRDRSKDGKVVWIPVGLRIAINPEQDLTGDPKLGVRLDYINHRWAFYHNDVIIKDDLPLYSEDGPASISIRAGVVPTDTLKLKELVIRDQPYGRSDLYLPAVDGKIDLGKAEQENDPRFRRPGTQPFGMPRTDESPIK